MPRRRTRIRTTWPVTAFGSANLREHAAAADTARRVQHDNHKTTRLTTMILTPVGPTGNNPQHRTDHHTPKPDKPLPHTGAKPASVKLSG